MRYQPQDIDFIVIGAEKSGTTWLADMLRQHPDVFIPERKEIFFFNERFFESPELNNFNFDKPLSWYLAFFDEAEPDQVKGEVCPAYLWDVTAPQEIFSFNPSVKIIAVLRAPVERAYSQFRYYVQRGVLEDISFHQAIEKRPDLISRSMYFDQLKRYFELFPQEHIKVLFFDDLKQDSQGFLEDVDTFLGIRAHIPKNIETRSNVTGVPRYKWLNRMIAKSRYFVRKRNPVLLLNFLRFTGAARLSEIIRLKNTDFVTEKPAPDSEISRQLREIFRADIEKLEVMTGRDLSGWK